MLNGKIAQVRKRKWIWARVRAAAEYAGIHLYSIHGFLFKPADFVREERRVSSYPTDSMSKTEVKPFIPLILGGR